ncbi:hypothetical protein F0562_007254 [Nyssa sinensis]|uniref:Uncharacterized protein n=1 Tax=Nyssa sinensis TaxID=561372 RepID=A0A5J5A4U6_9ASTE|nr:hypothetical protein F0562_007254 [Nyssa sinensis]
MAVREEDGGGETAEEFQVADQSYEVPNWGCDISVLSVATVTIWLNRKGGDRFYLHLFLFHFGCCDELELLKLGFCGDGGETEDDSGSSSSVLEAQQRVVASISSGIGFLVQSVQP